MYCNMLGNLQFVLVLSVLTVLIHWTNAIFSDDIPSFPSSESLSENDNLPTNKRYAMLSYNFGSNRRYQPSYSQSRRNTYFPKRYRYSSYWRPWESLPDYHCYRQRCNTSSDCCRRHNICDPYVKVCHDCWHGYKCQTSGDCCSRYPYCHPHKKECYN
ncbi:uncharacterized protein LOC125679168 isoform X2 [Ostrea edulis]|nr:uncharacterized protein LOC125679168 isoform X2 [Ostrea edulis]XP_048774102.2 uncharacterized protein LOC125679168 isoform X2 [Ostrea edulis]XP_048774103.2 uncharacterized protein LOC125679168 isoform X2 [Ostrea edulis]XP_048774104.2 uncharacterized protein LOC125679168 isoform X2 [Ostrea edulis]